MARFNDYGVVVTGGAGRMGHAIAAGFLAEGARVLLSDINEDGVKHVAKELDTGEGRVHSFVCDVTSSSGADALFAEAHARLGAIDVLCNNAGILDMGLTIDLTEQQWDLCMNVNAKSVYLVTHAFLPHMVERGGAIVNTASQAGKRGYRWLSHYCASKAAVMAFTKCLAIEVAPKVRVNCVCPGVVNTAMMEREYVWQTAVTGETKEEIQASWLKAIPMGRLQEPEHVANVVLFLASDDSSEMTGQALNVTGGMVME
jgi:NAD(P)-dependent dehydrogenase (short-subunit alcohol dehydrogenase family)